MTRHPGWGCGISGPLYAAAGCPCGALPAFLAWPGKCSCAQPARIVSLLRSSGARSGESLDSHNWSDAWQYRQPLSPACAVPLEPKFYARHWRCPNPAVVPSHHEAMHLGGILATATRSESLCTACHNASSNSSGSLSTCSRTRRSHPWPSNLMRMDSANSLQPLPGRP